MVGPGGTADTILKQLELSSYDAAHARLLCLALPDAILIASSQKETSSIAQ